MGLIGSALRSSRKRHVWPPVSALLGVGSLSYCGLTAEYTVPTIRMDDRDRSYVGSWSPQDEQLVHEAMAQERRVSRGNPSNSTTLSEYAVWLEAWISLGGGVRHSYDIDGSWYTLRQSGGNDTEYVIPTGYGALSLDLVMFDISPSQLVPTSLDRRDGWEWGHTNVYTMNTDPKTGAVSVWTNNPDSVNVPLELAYLLPPDQRD